MKKILITLLIALGLTGCGVNTPKRAVENYLDKYKNLDSEVLNDLEDIIESENLTEEQNDVYRSIMRKQYQDLEYSVVEEEYDDDISYVTAEITVYDLYKVQTDASIYLANNPEEFNDVNGVYDPSVFTDYKLEQMQNTTDRTSYTIIFTVTKEDGKYVVEQPSEETLEKIHGVYNYDLS